MAWFLLGDWDAGMTNAVNG
jgi:hypothetical protein